MNKLQNLAPNQLREIDFYGDTLVVALVENEAYIALKPIADYLGLDWSAQRQRLRRDEVLLRHSSSAIMIGADGKHREMICLQLEYLSGWLFGITPSRVKPELVYKLMKYREDCFKALWHTFSTNWGVADLSLGTSVFQPLNREYSNNKNVFFLTYEQIINSVRTQCSRAALEGLSSTLTIEQWLFVLKHFKGLCAYCKEKPGLLIEHFIPISLGGGTTIGNCVPSCYSCNSKKGDNHPSVITKISREALDNVQLWLDHSTGLVI